MDRHDLDTAEIKIRGDILDAHAATWSRIAGPGTWFDGPTRIAIAAETRNAPACALCADRKAALSPYLVAGMHGSLGVLPEILVETIHRIVSDPARLQRQWYEALLADGMTDTEYVEIVGVVCSTVSMDTFARAMDRNVAELPSPVPGAPSRYRPPGIKPGQAWVPWIAPEDVTEAEADLYHHGPSNIRKALTSVPDEQRGFFVLAHAQYLSGPQIRDVGVNYRAITRPQIELTAGRISALNQCVY